MTAKNARPLPRHEVCVRNYTVGGPVIDERGIPTSAEAIAAEKHRSAPLWVNGPGGHMRTHRDKK